MTSTAAIDDKPREDHQDLMRKLSLAIERIRDLEKHVSGQDAYIAALEARIATLERALAPLAKVADVYDKHPMEDFRRNHTDDTPVYSWFPAYCDSVAITVGDARHAARILKGTEDG